MRVNAEDVPISVRPYTDVVWEISSKTNAGNLEKFDFYQLPDRADFIEALFSAVCFENTSGKLKPSAYVHHDPEWNRWYRRWSHRSIHDQDSDVKDLLIDRDRLLQGLEQYLKSPDLRSEFLDWYCADTVAYAEYIATYRMFRDYGGGVFTSQMLYSESVAKKVIGLGLRFSWGLIKWGIWLALLGFAASMAWWATVPILAVTSWRQILKYKASKKINDTLFAMRGAYDVFQSKNFSWEVAWLELNKAREIAAIWPGELYRLVEIRKQSSKL